jgi:MFS family permease
MLPLQRQFQLTPTMQERIVSSTVLAAFITSLASGRCSMIAASSTPSSGRCGTLLGGMGRRSSLRIAALVFAVGSMLLLVAWDYPSLVAGRVVVGIAIGLCSVNSPLYIAELSTPTVRGRLVTVNALLVTVGQFAAGVVDGILDGLLPHQGWRLMLGLAAVPAIVMYLGLSALPESPRFLALQGQWEDARAVLKAYRESDDVADQELAEILESVKEESDGSSLRARDNNDQGGIGSRSAVAHHIIPLTDRHCGGLELSAPTPASLDDAATSTSCAVEYGSTATASAATRAEAPLTNGSSHRGWWEGFMAPIRSMFADPPTRNALAVGCGLMAIQQCSGINTVRAIVLSVWLAKASLARTTRLNHLWSSLFLSRLTHRSRSCTTPQASTRWPNSVSSRRFGCPP